jgi:hypothetical protein
MGISTVQLAYLHGLTAMRVVLQFAQSKGIAESDFSLPAGRTNETQRRPSKSLRGRGSFVSKAQSFHPTHEIPDATVVRIPVGSNPGRSPARGGSRHERFRACEPFSRPAWVRLWNDRSLTPWRKSSRAC